MAQDSGLLFDYYQLNLPDHVPASLAGEYSGKNSGSSIEYLDHKYYYPGDDIRNIDWRAYARTDKLTVKLYQEEISPQIDIVLDNSLSMQSTAKKWQQTQWTTRFFYELARKRSPHIRLFSLDQPYIKMEETQLEKDIQKSSQPTPIPFLEQAQFLKKNGIRIFISDFLYPIDMRDIIRNFENSSRFFLVQVLSDFENDPEEGGEMRLIESEDRQYIDLRLDKNTIAQYKKNLQYIQEYLYNESRKRGCYFCSIHQGMDSAAAVERFLQTQMIVVQ